MKTLLISSLKSRPVVASAAGLQVAAPRAAGIISSYPVLVFKKAGYQDTTYALTSTAQTEIAVTMAESSSTVCQLPYRLGLLTAQ